MGFSSITNPQYAALRALGIPAGHHDATRFVYFWAPPKTLVGFKRRRPSRYVPIESEEDHASDRRPPPRAEQAGSEAAVSPGRRSNEPHVPRRDFAPAELADVEADPAWPGQRDKRARGKTLVGFKRSRPSR
jgi:hypothetical protein